MLRTIGDRQVAVRSAATPETQDLLREQRSTTRQLARLIRASYSGTANDKDSQLQIIQLTHRKEQLERELAKKLPQYRALADRYGAKRNDLAGALAIDQAYVEFLWYRAPASTPGKTSKRYGAFVLLPGKPAKFLQLGEATEIEPEVIRFRQAIISGSDTADAGFRLSRLVWNPIKRILNTQTKSIYLSPDGLLTAIPWAALPDIADNSVLLEKYAFALVPSGHFLLEWLRAGAEATDVPGSLLAVGDVAYDLEPETNGRLAFSMRSVFRDQSKLVFNRLPATKNELDALTEIARGRTVRVLRGKKASIQNVIEELPHARVAHFATHGYFANSRIRSALQPATDISTPTTFQNVRREDGIARNPLLLSGLALAGANLSPQLGDTDDQSNDGILTAESISQLPLDHLYLAVLSACETGLGDVAGDEGVLGLQRAFHVAGAKNVIASLWNVDDSATAVLMNLLYLKMLKEKKSPLQALREAQLTLYHQPQLIEQFGGVRGRFDFSKIVPLNGNRPNRASDEKKVHPSFWAAFQLSGSGD